MPPHPSKKAVRIILIEIFFNEIEEIAKIPLVISTIPKIKLSAILDGICKSSSAGLKKIIKFFRIHQKLFKRLQKEKEL